MRDLKQGVLLVLGSILAMSLMAMPIHADDGGDAGDGTGADTGVQSPGDPSPSDPIAGPLGGPLGLTAFHVVDHLPYVDIWEGPTNVSFRGVGGNTPDTQFSHQGTVYTTISSETEVRHDL